ncbi:murein biosynthesis integral membrane protein MurJ [Streptomyces sp. NPDC004435]|uniref:murein biosynthesis integral membrane protein MurJ n=1 Tax=Streptomyces sp. NPDC004435 TaxID=3364701 RepID=UPI00369EB89C
MQLSFLGSQQSSTSPNTADGSPPSRRSHAKSSPRGRGQNLLKSSALMAAGTIVSRITGFLRTLVMAAAIGIGSLNDTYQVSNTLPTMIYILVGGGALNSVFIPQLVRAIKDGNGQEYANRLLTLVMVLLGGVTALAVLGAPVLVSLMSAKIAEDPETMEVAVTFARYCLPTIFFMGVHVVLGQILNAHERFGAMMWTPVLNNLIVIATFGGFIWAFGSFSTSGVSAANITPEGLRLLGIGTLLGLVVQAAAMLPYLREAGFRFQLRFDWRGSGLRKTAKLAKWTVLFVLVNQLGMIVVTQLATWAGDLAEDGGNSGTGITAYNYALLLWQMPQAIITVSVMTAVLPRISRAAQDSDNSAVADDISFGLRTSAVAIVPCAFLLLALGIPLTSLLYASSGDGAEGVGYALMAFSLGLIPYSAQYVILRGFYAYEDTRTPFYNTAIVAVINAGSAALCFALLPARWAVPGMAASYGLAYLAGVGVAWRRLQRRLEGELDSRRLVRTYTRLCVASIPAAIATWSIYDLAVSTLGAGSFPLLVSLTGGIFSFFVLFFAFSKLLRIEEVKTLSGMIRARLR